MVAPAKHEMANNPSSAAAFVETGTLQRESQAREEAIDEAVEESFPASDPPARTPVVRIGSPAQKAT